MSRVVSEQLEATSYRQTVCALLRSSDLSEALRNVELGCRRHGDRPDRASRLRLLEDAAVRHVAANPNAAAVLVEVSPAEGKELAATHPRCDRAIQSRGVFTDALTLLAVQHRGSRPFRASLKLVSSTPLAPRRSA